MNELHNASGSVSTRASLWVLCTICILTLGLGYLSASLLPATTPPVELTQDLAAIAPSHDAAPISDASYAPPVASQPAPPKPVPVTSPATTTVSTTVTLAPATSAPAKTEKVDAPVLIAQATPSLGGDQKRSGLIQADADVDATQPSDSLVPAGRQSDGKSSSNLDAVPPPQVETLAATDAAKGSLSARPIDAEGNLEPQIETSTPNIQPFAPGNDLCAGAVAIPNAFPNITAPVDISTATSTGDPGAFCATTVQSVWYSFVPTVTGTYRFTTCPSYALGGTSFDSVISVWRATGTCTGFTRIMCDDQDLGCPGSSNPSNGYITLTAGVQYYVVAGAFSTVSAGTNVVIRDKNNIVRIVVRKGPAGVASATRDLRALAGVKVVRAPQAQALPSGAAVKAAYSTQSAPNPVTGKRVTLMVDRYYVPHGGRVAIVDLGTPVGVDNVDAYRLMIQSFRWR